MLVRPTSLVLVIWELGRTAITPLSTNHELLLLPTPACPAGSHLDLTEMESGLGGELLAEGLLAPKSRPSQLPLSGPGLQAPGSGGAAWLLLAPGCGEAAGGFSPAAGPAPASRTRSSGEEVAEVSALLLELGLESSGIALV